MSLLTLCNSPEDTAALVLLLVFFFPIVLFFLNFPENSANRFSSGSVAGGKGAKFQITSQYKNFKYHAVCRADGTFNNVIRGTGAAVPTAAFVWRRTSGTNFQISKASGTIFQIRKAFNNAIRGTGAAVPTAVCAWRSTSGTNFQMSKKIHFFRFVAAERVGQVPNKPHNFFLFLTS